MKGKDGTVRPKRLRQIRLDAVREHYESLGIKTWRIMRSKVQCASLLYLACHRLHPYDPWMAYHALVITERNVLLKNHKLQKPDPEQWSVRSNGYLNHKYNPSNFEWVVNSVVADSYVAEERIFELGEKKISDANLSQNSLRKSPIATKYSKKSPINKKNSDNV